MQTKTIIAMARKKILESTEEIFSNEDLLGYANLSKDDVALRYLGNRAIKAAVLSFVNGSVTIPSDYLSFKYASNSSAPGDGTEYKYVDFEDFQTKKYTHMITESEGTLVCYPQESIDLNVWYRKRLTDMAVTPVPINPPSEIPSELHECIMYGVVYRAFEDAQDLIVSKYYFDKFEAEFKRRTEMLSMLEEGSLDSVSLLKPLPDFNYSNSAGSENRW